MHNYSSEICKELRNYGFNSNKITIDVDNYRETISIGLNRQPLPLTYHKIDENKLIKFLKSKLYKFEKILNISHIIRDIKNGTLELLNSTLIYGNSDEICFDFETSYNSDFNALDYTVYEILDNIEDYDVSDDLSDKEYKKFYNELRQTLYSFVDDIIDDYIVSPIGKIIENILSDIEEKYTDI